MKNGAPTHWKVVDLAEHIEKRMAERSLGGAGLPFDTCHSLAVGMMERLYHYASTYVPAGDIGKMSPTRIAAAMGWPSDDAAWLIGALKTCKLLDQPGGSETLRIHDWSEHAQDSVHKLLARERRWFADGKAPKISLLSEKERPPAKEFYERNANAPSAERTPEPAPEPQNADSDLGTNAPVSKAADQSALGSEGGCKRQTPENVPRLASPRLASSAPPTPRLASEPRPPDGGGGGGGSSSTSPDEDRAVRALRAPPWNVGLRKARVLARRHTPAVIERVLAEGRRARESATDPARRPGGGWVVTTLESGEGAELEAEGRRAAARERGRAWWHQTASPEGQAEALRQYREQHPEAVRQPEPAIVASPEFLEFIAAALDKSRGEGGAAA